MADRTLADDPKHREEIAGHLRRSLSHGQLSNIIFGTKDDVLAWLDRFNVSVGEQTNVAVYYVETIIVPSSSPGDHRHRIEQFRHVMNSPV